jgi:hypothetical protein
VRAHFREVFAMIKKRLDGFLAAKQLEVLADVASTLAGRRPWARCCWSAPWSAPALWRPGIAGGNDAVALLGNTLATGAILYVLITMAWGRYRARILTRPSVWCFFSAKS